MDKFDVAHEQPDIPLTGEQEDNLRKLSAFLATSPIELKFDMSNWQRPTEDASIEDDHEIHQKVECFTAACAVGWAPVAIPNSVKKEDCDDFHNYATRMFGCSNYNPNGSLFAWLFHADWKFTDNTPVGASNRINYFLEHGIPEDAYRRMRGKPYL